MIKKVKSNYWLAELLIPIYVIISQYTFKNGGISIGFYCLLALTIFYLIRNREISLFLPLILLISYMFLNDVLKSVSVMLNFALWFQYIIIFIFLLLIKGKLNEDNLYKIWKYVGVFAMVGLFYQSYQVFVQGIDVGIIKVLPFSSSAETFSMLYNRPHSIFLEPALYSTWILPLLYMSLKRKKYLFSFIITVSIFLTTSTIGLIMGLILWIYYLALDHDIKFKYKMMISVELVVLVLLLFYSPIFSATINKLSNEDIGNSVRTASGWKIYYQLSGSEKTIGILSNDLRDYLLRNIDLGLIGLNASASFLGFVNSLSYAAIKYGDIGLILYIYLFYSIWKNGKKDLWPYLLLCFLSTFGQSVFFNSIFVMQFSILLGTNRFCLKNKER